MISEIAERPKNAIVDMDSEAASAIAEETISDELDVTGAIVNGLNAGMRAVAGTFDRKEVFLPQVLASARGCPER